MRSIIFQTVLSVMFCSMASSLIAADTLIYSNSTPTGYVYAPGYDSDLYDFGSSNGGLVKRIAFGYQSTYSTSWAKISFYHIPLFNPFDPGYFVKTIYIDNIPPSVSPYSVHDYTLPEAEQFTLPSGSFGYSIAFSSSSTKVVLASGGLGQQDKMWQYMDGIYGWDWYQISFSNSWDGLYMKIWKGPPINEITCNIGGYKFNDTNSNGAWDAGEPALPGWDIYLDNDNDGIHDTAEPNVVTDPNGFYYFKNTPSPATSRIREVIKASWTQTLPGASGSYQHVVVTEPNHTYGPYNFGNVFQTNNASISGSVFYDSNGNSTRDAGESGQANWRVYIDTNGNSHYNTGEPTALTNASGNYQITSLGTGVYRIAEEMQEGWVQTYPTAACTHTVTISTSGQMVSNIHFGNHTFSTYGGGSGTQASPYLIYNHLHLQAIGAHNADWNKYFKLMANIDLSKYKSEEFNLIGTSNQPFTGLFDGNNLSIQNFSYISVNRLYVGLFAYVNSANAVVQNLVFANPNIQVGSTTSISQAGILAGRVDSGTITGCSINDGQITGTGRMGGLVGYTGTGASIRDCNVESTVTSDDTVGGVIGLNSGQINRCSFEGAVSGQRSLGGIAGNNGGYITHCSSSGTITIQQTPNTRYKAGGIAGYNSMSISYCHSSANVSGAEYMGGLVGDNYFADIYECYATGLVNGSIRLGGLVGYNHMSGIVNCYALGSVTGTGNAVGGLAGVNDHSYGTTRQIRNCYATGVVSGNTNKGGLVGYDSSGSGNFVKCFWNQTANPALNGIGNVTNAEVIGQSSANMKIKNTFALAGWDFDIVWRMCTDGAGYPKFQSLSMTADFACPDGVGIEDFAKLSKCWNSVLELQADINDNLQIDLADVAALGTYWMRVGCSTCGGKDITGDGNVNMADLEVLIDEWMLRKIPACSNADLSGDKVIETEDLILFCDNWLTGQ